MKKTFAAVTLTALNLVNAELSSTITENNGQAIGLQENVKISADPIQEVSAAPKDVVSEHKDLEQWLDKHNNSEVDIKAKDAASSAALKQDEAKNVAVPIEDHADGQESLLPVQNKSQNNIVSDLNGVKEIKIDSRNDIAPALENEFDQARNQLYHDALEHPVNLSEYPQHLHLMPHNPSNDIGDRFQPHPQIMHGTPQHGNPFSGMHGPPQGQHGPPSGLFGPQRHMMHGPPQGMHGPPLGMHGPPHGMHGPPQGMHGPPRGMHGPMHFGPPGSHSQMHGRHFFNNGNHPRNQNMRRNGRAIQMHSSGGPFEMRHMPPSQEQAMPVMMHLMHDLAGVDEDDQHGGAPIIIQGSPFGRKGMFGPHHPHFQGPLHAPVASEFHLSPFQHKDKNQEAPVSVTLADQKEQAAAVSSSFTSMFVVVAAIGCFLYYTQVVMKETPKYSAKKKDRESQEEEISLSGFGSPMKEV